MFYYISFLRPPPLQIAPRGSISITPQISNDLRTEPYQNSQDIYYSWTRYVKPSSVPAPTVSAPLPSNVITRPAKLTTYRHSSAYKEIPVPLPPGACEGEQWQLILSATQSTPSLNYAIDLCEYGVGNLPLPVISMPILFSAKGLKGNAKKQERIERIYRISGGVSGSVSSEDSTLGVAGARDLKITEQTSFDLDKKIWDSGIGLSSWLVEFQTMGPNSRNQTLNTLWNAIFSTEPRRMVELGAGTGIVSLMVASLRSQFNTSGNQRDTIITTDLATAIPLLNHNISSNIHLYPYNAPKSDVLNWEDESLPASVNSLENVDVILMSDVTYNTSSFPALIRTMERLIRLGNGTTVVLLGYKERDRAERDLWEMMENIGLRPQKITECMGAGEPAVEVWTA